MSWDFCDEPPSDPWEFEFWMTVRVGDGRGGSNFQVHVSAPALVRTFWEKKGLFILEEWKGEQDLIDKLNAFIAAELEKNPIGDPYHSLGEHWLWEYARMR